MAFKISVILPAYNAEKFIESSISSILNQTHSNFELIIIDDGSTDATLKLVKGVSDTRIKLIVNDSNKGLVFSLNKGIEVASGEYIARMDADDFSHPERFEKQVDFLEDHSDIDILGTAITIFDDTGTIGKWSVKESHDDIVARLLFRSGFYHPTIMGRSEVFKNNLYNSDYPHAEDYKLWVDLIQDHKFANLNSRLLFYREHPNSVGNKFSKAQLESISKIHKDLFQSLGIEASQEELNLHRELGFQGGLSIKDQGRVESWLQKIILSEADLGIEGEVLRREIRVIWEKYLKNCSRGDKDIQKNIIKRSSLLTSDEVRKLNEKLKL